VSMRKKPRGMRLDSVAHILYNPTMRGKRLAVARWHHHIHLIPGWLFGFICDRFEASLWRGLPEDYCPHVSYSSLPGLTCGCGLPIANVTTGTTTRAAD
jgi:hypothetical protein